MTDDQLPAPVPAPDLVSAAGGTVEEAVQAMRAYRLLCERLLTDGDYQTIGDQRFKKKSAWRKLALAFNVSVREVSHVYRRDPESGLVIFAEFVMQACAPNGRTMDGIGVCSSIERSFVHPEHDLIATACTRATNRACADLFGMGEESAEEAGEPRATIRGGPRRAADRIPDHVRDDAPEARGYR